jgi:chromate reductase
MPLQFLDSPAVCERALTTRHCCRQRWKWSRTEPSCRFSTLRASLLSTRTKIRAADAILIATPEYNYSVPGVLKNAIDWASRPHGDNALEGKPLALMGASGGMLGTARAQYHLRQTFVWLNVHPLNKPEVMVPFAADKFDSTGKLTDPKTREKIKELLDALIPWAKKFPRG